MTASQGLVSFASQQYQQALGHFVKAVQTNPAASGASVRLAVAACCFKLEQYDRARVALDKCTALDVSEVCSGYVSKDCIQFAKFDTNYILFFFHMQLTLTNSRRTRTRWCYWRCWSRSLPRRTAPSARRPTLRHTNTGMKTVAVCY